MNLEEEARKRRTYNVYVNSPKMIGDVYRIEKPVVHFTTVPKPAHKPSSTPVINARPVPRPLMAPQEETGGSGRVLMILLALMVVGGGAWFLMGGGPVETAPATPAASASHD